MQINDTVPIEPIHRLDEKHDWQKVLDFSINDDLCVILCKTILCVIYDV